MRSGVIIAASRNSLKDGSALKSFIIATLCVFIPETKTRLLQIGTHDWLRSWIMTWAVEFMELL